MQQIIERFHQKLEMSEVAKKMNSFASSLELMRKQVWADFEQDGLPRKKDEFWKYTSPQPFQNWLDQSLSWGQKGVDSITSSDEASCLSNAYVNFQTFYDEASDQFRIDHLDAQSIEWYSWRQLFSEKVNVDYQALALIEESLALKDGFHRLNHLFFSKGGVLVVNETPRLPVVLNFTGQLEFEPSRVIIIVQPGVQLEVLEIHSVQLGQVAPTVPLTQLSVLEGSRVDHLKIIESNQLHLSTTVATLGPKAQLYSLQLTKSTQIARSQISVNQRGPEGEAILTGLAYLKGSEVSDHRFEVNHFCPQGMSQQIYKTILDDQSRSVFNGKIFIGRGAEKVDSSQLNKNLLLSRQAEADSKPELEVYADDVKAGHGASIGQLNEEELFYLRSRGISIDIAQKMLTDGFVRDLIDRFPIKSFQKIGHNFIESARGANR